MGKRILLGGSALLLVCALPAWAGKNNGGAMIVHTNATLQYTGTGLYCTTDYQEPASCAAANTINSVPSDKAGVIWFLAAFHETASPGVITCHFGNNHNLPPGQGYFQAYGFCGPAGSLEVPDDGWPEQPATAGNSVGFGSPVTGDLIFPFYWFGVYGFEGAYLGSGVNPTTGYAAFVTDDNPGFLDRIDKFGTVRWYAQGENTCPEPPIRGACCLPDATCTLLFEAECENAPYNGRYQGDGTTCQIACGACCYWNLEFDLIKRRCVVTGYDDCNDPTGLDAIEHQGIGSEWSYAGAQCAANADEADTKWWCQQGTIPTIESSWGKLKSLYR